MGAYRRPLADVKTARVRFTTECLGFSNVPDRATMDLVMDGATPPPHHPRWKSRVPRDSGAGWDFEDIRDHYLQVLFGRDAVELRSRELERYYALSRVVTGEVMLRTFAEWRAPGSCCGGALVWFLRDLLPGAGWGIVDSTGAPKAAFWYLKRAWSKRGVYLTDEGLDGFAIHAINEEPRALEAILELEMYREGRDVVANTSTEILVAPCGTLTLQADQLLGHFTDATYSYRFGPPRHDIVAARLRDAKDGHTIAEDFCFPTGLGLPVVAQQIQCALDWIAEGRLAVTISSPRFLQSVSITSPGWMPDDNYFHVAPGHPRRVLFDSRGGGVPFRAQLEALNAAEAVSLRAAPPDQGARASTQ